LRRSTARCDCFEPPSLEKLPRTANARASWTGRRATASTLTSTSTTRTHRRERAKSSSQLQHCCKPCLLPRRPRRRTCTARRRRSLSRRSCNRPRARRLASASREARGTTGACRAPRRRVTWVVQRDNPPTRAERRSRSESLTRAGRPRTATPATSSTPGGRATRRHGRRWATTRGRAGVTTAVRTTHRHWSPRGPTCSAGRSAPRASRSASASPRRSTSTRGRRTPCMAQ
jgi:hypothetical protein